MQGYCSSKSSDIASPTHSIHTPQAQKKKVSPDAELQYNYAQQQQQQTQQQQRNTQRSGGSGGGSVTASGKSYGAAIAGKLSINIAECV